MRQWHYYFAYCEVGFEVGHIDDWQVCLKKQLESETGRTSRKRKERSFNGDALRASNAGLLGSWRALKRPKTTAIQMAVGSAQRLLDRGLMPDWLTRAGWPITNSHRSITIINHHPPSIIENHFTGYTKKRHLLPSNGRHQLQSGRNPLQARSEDRRRDARLCPTRPGSQAGVHRLPADNADCYLWLACLLLTPPISFMLRVGLIWGAFMQRSHDDMYICISILTYVYIHKGTCVPSPSANRKLTDAEALLRPMSSIMKYHPTCTIFGLDRDAWQRYVRFLVQQEIRDPQRSQLKRLAGLCRHTGRAKGNPS